MLLSAVLGALLMSLTLLIACSEGNDVQIRSLRGAGALLPLKIALEQRNRGDLIYTCDQTERALTEHGRTEELEDWIELAKVCNTALDGKWVDAAQRLARLGQQ